GAVWAPGCGALASAAGASAAGASAAGAAGWAGAAALGAAGSPLAASSTLSPSSAISAIGALTATCSVPSGTTILAKVPSSTASNSIGALSVQISARRSPAFTLSPGCLCHLAILPSVMVGERAGINTSIGIGSSLSVNVGPEFARIGLWRILRELSGRRHDVLDLLVDLFE